MKGRVGVCNITAAGEAGNRENVYVCSPGTFNGMALKRAANRGRDKKP